ncbi:WAT1-related protein At5g64700-like [Ipomoea triloba]|uniref:WAT1-related protein At5g64700-like n=1 Tax=Ipomoea triloba TaxID=35885 RepID=UPI00125E21CE|nr:WAT1-related protein At5g64700-like [Ipomoea triloba]GMC64325.1 WAT1-related protein At5g64700-like [Ipomoea batatas]
MMEGSVKKPYLAVLAIQSIYAGMFLLSKVAFDVGMNTSVFVFYRQAAATVFLAPIALLVERKTAPRLTFTTFFMIFMLSLIGITISLNIYGVALKYTSATLAAATTNSLPVVTFLLALLFRMERVELGSVGGIVKVLGIGLCMGGAATIAFYRGPTLRLLMQHHLINHHDQQLQLNPSSGQAWVKGVFLMILANTCWSLWLVVQGRVLKAYPSKLLCTTLQCFTSTIQSFVVAIALVRDPREWQLGWNVKLLSVAYCGIVVTGVTFYLQAWVVEKKGPLFLAMTTPLALIITIVTSALLLGEIISLGSILGGLLLVGGLYSVLWGKNREHKIESDITFVDDIEKAGEPTKTVETTAVKNPAP